MESLGSMATLVRSLRESYLVGVGFYFLEEAGCCQVFLNLLAYVETVHAYVHACGFADGSVVVEDVDGGEVVFLAEHVVVDVVGGGYLQASGSELDVYVVSLQ